jgi:glutamine synthetase
LIRIPEVVHPSSSRIELRSPDPSTNPYLAFAVVLKAGLDGIENKIEAEHPIESDIYENKLYKTLDSLPSNLKEALEFLEKDEVIKETLGLAYEKFVELKKSEIEEYMQKKITDWELEKYLDV